MNSLISVSYVKNRDDISIHLAYTLYQVQEIKSHTAKAMEWESWRWTGMLILRVYCGK